jgi:hypothetical protein
MKTYRKTMVALLAASGFLGFSSLATAQDIRLPRRTPELKRLEITNTVTRNSPTIDVRLPSRGALSTPTPALGANAAQAASNLGSAAGNLLQQVPSLPTPSQVASDLSWTASSLIPQAPTGGSANVGQNLQSALSSVLPRQGSVQITIPSELLSTLTGNLPTASAQ